MQLRQHYRPLVEQLPAPALTAYQAASRRQVLPKGYYLCHQGAVCRYVRQLESGSARVFRLQGATEVTTAFLFAGDFATSFQSFYLQVPSPSAIQLLGESEVTLLGYEALQHLKAAYPEIDQIDRLSNDYYTMWLEQRLFALQCYPARRRYQELLEQEPHLLQKVSLGYIAPYLGITRETLSRIRARKDERKSQ